MTRIVLTEFISLDGVIEEPRWTFQFERGPEGGKFKFDELFDCDALLLGRVTYQGFAQAWPSMAGDEFGRRMNSIAKYVVSSTLTDAEATWGPTTVLSGDVVTEITRLKAQPGGTLLVEGSAQLAQALIRHGLVDAYRLMLFPIVLGSGRRLFPQDAGDQARLTLTGATPDRDGVMLLTYEPRRPGRPLRPAARPDQAGNTAGDDHGGRAGETGDLMKQYLLSVHMVEGSPAPPPEAVQRAYQDVAAFNAELQSAGAWVFAGGLHPPGTATVVRVNGGDVLITDGPFAEGKEHIGGFWVIKAANLDAALDWATRATRACAAPVEVRPFQEETQD